MGSGSKRSIDREQGLESDPKTSWSRKLPLSLTLPLTDLVGVLHFFRFWVVDVCFVYILYPRGWVKKHD